MNYRILLVLIWVGLTTKTNAQLLSGQAPAGTSTLILPGSTIGLTLPKDGELSFSFYSKYDRRLFYGLTAAAKNQEGLGTLFDAGQFSPAASLKGAVGISWSWIKNFNKLEREAARTREVAIRKGVGIDSLIRLKIDSVKNQTSTLGNDAPILADSLLGIYNDTLLTSDEILLEFKEIATGTTDFSKKVRIIVEKLIRDINALYATGNSTRENFMLADLEFRPVSIKPIRDSKLFVFLRQSAAQYYTFDSLKVSNPVSSIEKQNYSKADFGIGFNHRQGGRLWFGVNYGWRRGNTISLLSKDDYTLRTVISTANQSVTKEKKITAYQGNYREFKQQFFYADLLWVAFVPKQKTDRHFKPNRTAQAPKILLNPYFRLDISREKDVFPTVATLGLSTLFKSRTGFLGGLYIEGADLANNVERFQATRKSEIPTLTPLYNRLSFGITTQFELISIFN